MSRCTDMLPDDEWVFWAYSIPDLDPARLEVWYRLTADEDSVRAYDAWGRDWAGFLYAEDQERMDDVWRSLMDARED